jgi:hypothetical protein
LTSRQSSPTARILLWHTLRRGRKKWAVSIHGTPLKIARRTLVVKAVGAQAPRSARRRCWEPAVECSASTIVWPAPYVARTRTCAGDLRIPLILMHTSLRLSLAAPATPLPRELLTPPAGPVRSVNPFKGRRLPAAGRPRPIGHGEPLGHQNTAGVAGWNGRSPSAKGNLDEVRQTNRAYWEANREKIRPRQRKYRAAKRAKAKERGDPGTSGPS